MMESMTPDDDNIYPLQPADDEGADGESSPAPSEGEGDVEDEQGLDIEVSRGVEALSLEEIDITALELPDRTQDEEEPEKSTFQIEIPDEDADGDKGYVRTLDVCPNCGKAMGKTKNLVCFRCGYDIKTMKIIKTKTGTVTKEQLKKERGIPSRLSKKGRGDFWLPAAMGGPSLLFLLIGFAVGAGGLFQQEFVRGVPIPIENVERMAGLFEEFGLILFWIACGMGGLYSLARLLERPLGKRALAVARIAGLVCTMRLATFVNLEIPATEWSIELFLQFCVSLPAVRYFFRLNLRDATTLIFIAMLFFVGVYLVVSVLGSIL